jgi:hypothetical protein
MTQDFRKNAEKIILSLLIGGNIFFVKRLVDEMDNTHQAVIEVQRDVAVIKSRMDRKGFRDAYLKLGPPTFQSAKLGEDNE